MQAAIQVELFGKVQDIDCRCGCGQVHKRLRGQATRPEIDSNVLFLALLAHHPKGGRHIWLAIGTGPWEADDPRDCFCSVEAWLADDNIASRLTEGRASPFAGEELFADAARFVSRDEVLCHPERKDWLFEWVDDLVLQVEPLRRFILAKD